MAVPTGPKMTPNGSGTDHDIQARSMLYYESDVHDVSWKLVVDVPLWNVNVCRSLSVSYLVYLAMIALRRLMDYKRQVGAVMLFFTGMSQSTITLYDIHSTIPQPWAPNIWRVRFILNYKRLPHGTVWIEFSDVEATLRMIGAPPTSKKSDVRPVYTLPVIIDSSPSPNAPIVLSNANIIAEYLDAAYPARPILPEGSRALQALFVHYIQDIFVKPLLPILVPLTHQRLLERSQAHFRHGGGPGPFPTSLIGSQHEQAWAAVKEQFNFLAAILDKNNFDGNGVVAMGRDISYADFALCSVLIWVEKVSPHDCWARIREWNGGRWAKLYTRCREYMDVY